MTEQLPRQSPPLMTEPYATPGHAYPVQPLRTGSNSFAIAGFVLSFFGGCLGLIFSIIGLIESKKFVNRAGRGLAIAGICISVVVTVVSVAALVLVIAGASESIDEYASRQDTTGGTDVVATNSLKVGDCLDQARVPMVIPLPCTVPHESEVYHRAHLTYATYPGDDVVISEAETRCAQEFGPFIGTSPDKSTLVVTYSGPTEDTWAGGERDVLCMVGEAGTPTVATTLRGAAR